jgi:hypothetical protein
MVYLAKHTYEEIKIVSVVLDKHMRMIRLADFSVVSGLLCLTPSLSKYKSEFAAPIF